MWISLIESTENISETIHTIDPKYLPKSEPEGDENTGNGIALPVVDLRTSNPMAGEVVLSTEVGAQLDAVGFQPCVLMYVDPALGTTKYAPVWHATQTEDGVVYYSWDWSMQVFKRDGVWILQE